MNSIQKVEFEALKAVAKVCDKHNIDYMLFGGTVLGAVRHGGFIPWDDDIDICMTVPEYFKFLNVAQEELGEKYFVQNYKTVDEYFDLWTNIIVNDTTSMPVKWKSWNIHFGISIDIFPIIGLADNLKDREKQKKMFKWHRILLADKFSKATNEKISWKLKAVYLIPRKIRKWMCKHMDKKIFIDYESCRESAEVWCTLLEFPKECFDDIDYIEFEGHQFKTMKKYKQWLKHKYGDYMKLPPENERTGHDLTLGEIIYDTKKDYRFYK